MPNYEYQCTECNHRFEIWQTVGEAAPACPECGSAVKKIFHAPRVHFKGSGFYVTDLRAEKSGQKGDKKSKEETATTSESSDSTNGTAAETKTETPAKTETKAESPSTSTSTSNDKSTSKDKK